MQGSRTITVLGVGSVLVVGALVVVSVALLHGRTGAPVARDPETRQALLAVAVRFNDNYAHNRDGLVYDRWDASSQSVITRAR